jgi:hypothetical protein
MIRMPASRTYPALIAIHSSIGDVPNHFEQTTQYGSFKSLRMSAITSRSACSISEGNQGVAASASNSADLLRCQVSKFDLFG